MLVLRRLFLGGLGAALVAAPAIVRAQSIMPVRSIARLILPTYGFDSFNTPPDGWTYQWSSNMEEISNGWEPVPPGRYADQFSISTGRIEFGGLILVQRPAALTVRARALEIQRAYDLESSWKRKWESEGFLVEVKTTPNPDIFTTVVYPDPAERSDAS